MFSELQQILTSSEDEEFQQLTQYMWKGILVNFIVIINHQLYLNDTVFYFAYDLLWVRFLIYMYNVFNSLIFYHLLYDFFSFLFCDVLHWTI